MKYPIHQKKFLKKNPEGFVIILMKSMKVYPNIIGIKNI